MGRCPYSVACPRSSSRPASRAPGRRCAPRLARRWESCRRSPDGLGRQADPAYGGQAGPRGTAGGARTKAPPLTRAGRILSATAKPARIPRYRYARPLCRHMTRSPTRPPRHPRPFGRRPTHAVSDSLVSPSPETPSPWGIFAAAVSCRIVRTRAIFFAVDFFGVWAHTSACPKGGLCPHVAGRPN